MLWYPIYLLQFQNHKRSFNRFYDVIQLNLLQNFGSKRLWRIIPSEIFDKLILLFCRACCALEMIALSLYSHEFENIFLIFDKYKLFFITDKHIHY